MTRRLRPFDWLGEPDGTGHALVRGASRALCGVSIDARYAHPVKTRHDDCVEAARQYEERRRAWART